MPLFPIVLCALFTGSATLVPGRTVARVQLDAPASREFVLQATIPVPPGVFPSADGSVPFAVRDHDGTIKNAQVEVVTRYPSETDGAAVVEIAARVHRGLTEPTGSPITYDVLFSPHAPEAFHADSTVEADLLRNSGAVRLIARDVFNNVYTLDPLRADLPSKTMREGSAIRERRTYGSMMPVAPRTGPNATLAHFLGVHAYVREFDAQPFLELDLRFHNGHSGLDHTTAVDNPLGTVYFESVELIVPAGWRVRDADPDAFEAGPVPYGGGERFSVIKPMPDGTMHFMPRQGQTVRRLVIYRPGDQTLASDHVTDRNLAFVRRGQNGHSEELFSWWNPDTANYFPQRHRLPELSHVPLASIQAGLTSHANLLTSALMNGSNTGYPVMTGALGWAHPYGVDDGGMAGGDGIVMYDGLRVAEAASNAGWRELAMRNRMLTDRHPVALYDQDGEPSQYESWVLQSAIGPWLPVWCFLTPILFAADPFGFTTAPTFQVDAVHAQHRQPPYEELLSTFHPIDFEHFVRYTSPAKSLVWLGNDSIAKDALFLNACLFRMSYNDLPNSTYGNYISTGLANDQMYVAGRPGFGLTFGRLESWGTDCVAAAYASADLKWRRHVEPWFAQIVDLLDIGQSQCSGIIQSTMYEQFFNGTYRARQSIEQAITENMLISVRETVMNGLDPWRTMKCNSILRKSCYAMVTAPCWSTQFHSPWQKLAVGDGNFTHPPFCGNTPIDGFADGGDAYQCWSSFAYAYEITGNQFYLDRAQEMEGGGALLVALQAAGLSNLENRAALLALVQALR